MQEPYIWKNVLYRIEQLESKIRDQEYKINEISKRNLEDDLNEDYEQVINQRNKHSELEKYDTKINLDKEKKIEDNLKDDNENNIRELVSKNKRSTLFKEILTILKKIWLKWIKNTGWTGPGIIIRRKNIINKIIWLVLFLLFMGATIYLLVITVLAYLSYAEVTSISSKIDSATIFPTITICNLNYFYLDSLTDTNRFNQLNDYNYYSNNDGFNGTTTNLNNTLENSRFQKLVANYKYTEFPRMFQTAQSEGFQNLIKDFRKKTLNCGFLGKACDLQTDFTVYPTTDFLFCFKYNFDINNLKTVDKAGLLNAFSFSFYLGDHTKDIFSKNRGLRIFVHNSTEDYPTSAFTEVFDISPGYVTNIAVKQTKYQRLSFPYTNCIDDVTSNNPKQTDIMKYMFNTLKVKNYESKLCQSILFSQSLSSACGCVDMSFLISEMSLICHSSSQIDCLNQFRSQYSADQSSNCPTECASIYFDTNVFYEQFLSDWYVDYMKNSIKPYLNNLNDSAINPQILTLNQAFPQNADIISIRDNIVAFNIFFDDLAYNVITQTPSFNWFLLLANLAGICGGSFLGMSLLSIVEFFEYILFSIYVAIIFFIKKLKLNVKFTKIFGKLNKK